MKTCRICQQTKPLNQMKKNVGMPDGHECICGTCNSQRAKAWYHAHKADIAEDRRIYAREYLAEHMTDPAFVEHRRATNQKRQRNRSPEKISDDNRRRYARIKADPIRYAEHLRRNREAARKRRKRK